jgi:hypothetical protein
MPGTQSYIDIIERSEQVSWLLDDVIRSDHKLDFSRPFVPNPLFDGAKLDILNDEERRQLNQLFANGYAYIFYFVESTIIAMVMNQAMAELYGDEPTLRALLRFAEEEVKHQQMFLRFCNAFKRGCGVHCQMLEDPQVVGQMLLARPRLALILVVLHLEWISMQHFVESVKDDGEIEPTIITILRNHWLEEAQHTKLDMLEIEKLVSDVDPAQRTAAVDAYFEILGGLAELLRQQAIYDTESLERITGHPFAEEKRTRITNSQHRSYVYTWIVLGLKNLQFIRFLERVFGMPPSRAADNAVRFDNSWAS